MKIIYNRYIPFGPFFATNIFGIIFCRSDKGRMNKVDENHEYIHTLQQREMLYIFFMLWYNIEWLYRLCKTRDFMKAYHGIYFEREAYKNERNLNYANERKPFGWWHQFVKEGTILHELGCFLGDVASFIRDDFKVWKYLYFLLFAVTLIIAQVKFNIYDWLIDPSYYNGTSMIRLPMVYITVYYLMLIPTLAFHKELWRLKQWQAWVLPVFLITVDGAGQGFYAYKDWIVDAGFNGKDLFYLTNVGAFLFRSVFIVFMLCMFKWLTSGKFGLYGLVSTNKYLRIYGVIYLVLLPIFIVVSTTPQFLDFYPRVALQHCSGALGWSNWQLCSLFELCYANDFLGVESMFRGAMVIGLSRWLGPRTVLPMAITYMSIHLGKPDLELCSSVIGGYFLGILAYKTKHLWGGIIIHLGIAMLFEVLGLWHI